MHLKKTPELVAKAKELRKTGMAWKNIGPKLGVAPHTARAWVDEEFRLHRIQTYRTRRMSTDEVRRDTPTDRSTWADALERLALIPEDTRDTTARICGDPLPGRSALDRRLQS